MSADVMQFIPRPSGASEQTDFPTIAFRFVVQEFANDPVDTAPCEYVEPEGGET